VIIKILRITWIPVVLVLLYSGWLIWRRNQPVELQQRPVPVAGRDPYGTDLKILSLTADPGVISHGGKALLCYGVVNSTAVKIDPPVESVWPSLTRCFEVTPAKTTRYTLTAEDAAHHTVSGSVDVLVK
jgi:hypothetical protein